MAASSIAGQSAGSEEAVALRAEVGRQCPTAEITSAAKFYETLPSVERLAGKAAGSSPGTKERTTKCRAASRLLRHISFRTKIVALLLFVEAIVLGILVWQSSVLELQRIDRDFGADLSQVRPLLNAAVEIPVMQNDRTSLQRILDDSVNSKGYQYLVVKDRQGNLLAAAGIRGDALPQLDASIEDAFKDRRYDTAFPLAAKGEPIGTMHVGISLDREMKALDDALRENVIRSGSAFLITILLFLAVIQPFAHRLGRLQKGRRTHRRGRLRDRGGGSGHRRGRHARARIQAHDRRGPLPRGRAREKPPAVPRHRPTTHTTWSAG
jgi:hypothetical protein